MSKSLIFYLSNNLIVQYLILFLRINNTDNSSDYFYQQVLKKATSSLGLTSSPKNMLIDSFNNNFWVALNLILEVLNKALESRTQMIFAELASNIKVKPS